MRDNERDEQRLLHLVEAALRDGRSEREVEKIVAEAAEADAELDAAA